MSQHQIHSQAFLMFKWGSLPCPVTQCPSQLAAELCWFSCFFSLGQCLSSALMHVEQLPQGRVMMLLAPNIFTIAAITVAPSGGHGEFQASVHLMADCLDQNAFVQKRVEGWVNASPCAHLSHGGSQSMSTSLLRSLTWEVFFCMQLRTCEM